LKSEIVSLSARPTIIMCISVPINLKTTERKD
jgi:hypothetical protein